MQGKIRNKQYGGHSVTPAGLLLDIFSIADAEASFTQLKGKYNITKQVPQTISFGDR